MLVWIFAVLAIAGAWVTGFFFEYPLAYRIAITVVAVLFVVGYYVVRRLRAKSAARALERELLKQAEQQAANARPDRRAEINELQAQFKRGLGALKSSRLGAGSGANALYALPWYMIVGPPGAGKTTAIRHSGLDFPIPDATSALRGVGGTKNCDWWFTNEAILLDTAGRFATQEDDREEWAAFLDMLRRYRTKTPINGVLVAISITDVVGATEEQAEQLAKALRARIDEVMTKLQMVVPVYVTFTKVDLIAGFVETFEELKKSERAQIWGMTFPLAQTPADEPAKAFEAEFDILIEALHAHALRRLSNVRGHEKRARIHQFPMEMRALKAPLAEFIGALLRKNTFQETPLFRGAYFTSGTQEGRPLDRVMAGMQRAFGLRMQGSVEPAAPSTDAKSYFLTDLFRRVIFPDQFVAARTRGEARRQLLVKIGTAAAAVALAALILVPAIVSFVNNRELVRTTTAAVDEAQRVDWNDRTKAAASLARLEPLRSRLQQLDTWKKDGAPFSYRWGMYEGNALLGPTRDAYVGILQRAMVVPVKVGLEEHLRSIDANPQRSPEQFNVHYDELKKYLMLTEREHLDVEWAAPRVTRLWAEAAHVKNHDDEAIVHLNVEQYLRLAKEGAVKPAPRDERLVTYARSELLRTPQMGRLYENLVRDTNIEIAPLRRETIFYGSSAAFVSSRRNLKIDGAYTKLGWLKVRRLLESERSKLNSEGWVLGTEDVRIPADQTEKEVAALRQLYFDRYREAWRDFLADLVVARPTSSEASLEELLALTEPEWPYLRLVRAIAENTELEVSDSEAGRPGVLQTIEEKAKSAAKSKLLGQPIDLDAGALLDRDRARSPVENAFKPIVVFGVPSAAPPGAPAPPTGLSQYMGVLRKLIGVLGDLKDGKAQADPKALTGEFETAYRSTTALLADQDAFTRPLMSPLLLDPIAFSWGSVLKDAGGAAGGLWEMTAWKTWSTKLEPTYPFDARAVNDAKIEDFTDFFRPEKGELWGFYEANLKGSLEQQGDDFTASRRFKSQVPYSNEFLTSCLKRASKITNATFGSDPKTPSVAFEVNLHSVSSDVSEVTIEVDGVSRTYTNTPEEWLAVTWPAKDAKQRGAKVRVRGLAGLSEEINRAGDFGLFHLLDAADLKPATIQGKNGDVSVIVATWKLSSKPDANVKIDIKPAKSDAPFGKGFFSGLKCPRIITQGER